jgi:hypothetical protein
MTFPAGGCRPFGVDRSFDFWVTRPLFTLMAHYVARLTSASIDFLNMLGAVTLMAQSSST